MPPRPCLLVAFLLGLASGLRADSAVPRYLFLDPAFVSDSRGVSFRVNPAQRRETLRGREVRVEFQSRRTKLYSFRFE